MYSMYNVCYVLFVAVGDDEGLVAHPAENLKQYTEEPISYMHGVQVQDANSCVERAWLNKGTYPFSLFSVGHRVECVHLGSISRVSAKAM